jgi:hypothetical protein
MKVAITDENSGSGHIAGTIARPTIQFWKPGVFAANFYPNGGTFSYTRSYRAFRGFDGANAV